MIGKKKRMFLKGLVLSLAMLGLCACSSGKAAKGTDKSLYEHGLDVVALMAEMAQTDDYVTIYSGSQEMRNVIKKIGEGDFSEPKAVYEISVDDESLLALADGVTGLEGASEELRQAVRQKLLASLMMQINGMSGAVDLASSNVCVAGKTFVKADVEKDTIYLYTYEHALPAAVTFTTGEDGTVSASGVFILFDQFTCGSEEEIKSYFQNNPVKVKEVKAVKAE